MGLGTLLGEEEDDNKLASRRIRTSTRRKNVPERFCPPPPPACPSETALAASLGPSGVRLRADERLQLDLFRPARPHSTAPPRTPRPTCPGTPESWSVGAPPQSLTGVNEDDPPRPGALGSGTFPCPPASPPPPAPTAPPRPADAHGWGPHSRPPARASLEVVTRTERSFSMQGLSFRVSPGPPAGGEGAYLGGPAGRQWAFVGKMTGKSR